MVIVIMGVSGVGKTTVGRELAAQLGWPFHDADDLHGRENVARMREGMPLTDEHRAPWLDALARLIGRHVRDGRSMILACSALSRSHRAILLSHAEAAGDVRLVHLHATRAVLAERLAQRTGHFFPPDLLGSQLTALEAPEDEPGTPVLSLDATRPVSDLVAAIRAELDV